MRRFWRRERAAGRKNSLSHGLKFRIFSRLVIVVSLILLILSMALFVVITSVLRFSLESRGKDDIQFLAYLLNDALSNAIAAGKTLAIHPEVQELLKQEYNRDEPEDAFAIRAYCSRIMCRVSVSYLHHIRDIGVSVLTAMISWNGLREKSWMGRQWRISGDLRIFMSSRRRSIARSRYG